MADAARLYILSHEPPSLYTNVFEPLCYAKGQTDFCLFWDFGSLHQGEDRSDVEKVQFRQGLADSNVWYGHKHTMMWIQSSLPGKFKGQTYESSGWCYFEASLSSVLKSTELRLDLGKRLSGSLAESYPPPLPRPPASLNPTLTEYVPLVE